MQDTNHEIFSFVLRFIKTRGSTSGDESYRGTIRHVQTGLETNFIHWEDIHTFVDLFLNSPDLLTPEEKNDANQSK
jgi:hypothetical protein